MSRLSRLAVSKRSVTLLLAGALFVAGISAWGSLKQELLPDIAFPVITVVTTYPGRGLVRRPRTGHPADRADHRRRATAGDHPVDVVELGVAGRQPVRVRDGCSEDDGRDRTGAGQGHAARNRDADGPGPQYQRRPGGHLVDRRDQRGWPRGGGNDRAARDRARDRRHRGRRAGGPDRWTRDAAGGDPRSGPARGDGRVDSADRRRPGRQQPDPAVRPAVGRRDTNPGLHDRPAGHRRGSQGARRRLRGDAAETRRR